MWVEMSHGFHGTVYRVQRKEQGRTQENIDTERRGKQEAEAKLAARREDNQEKGHRSQTNRDYQDGRG